MKRRLAIALFIVAVFLAGFFYFRFEVYYSHGTSADNIIFQIEKGEGNEEIAKNLRGKGLISREIYFYYYIKMNDLIGKVMPGEYQLSGKMTIPEIAQIITSGEEKFIKITFPEGFTAELMAKRLNANNLPGDEFLKIVRNPEEFKKRYSYLSPEEVKTLEGYLFPDTYFFKKETEAKDIVGRMLDTFDQRLTEKMRVDIESQKKSITDIVIMASIVEKEVQTSGDMQMVAGVFWKRIEIGQRLQSDATLTYLLGDKDDQHSGAELEIDSPYNSYRYAGLPPGPIGNPGLNALRGAIYPETSSYLYFLTATVGGEKKVIYSKTFEEHVANKRKYGL